MLTLERFEHELVKLKSQFPADYVGPRLTLKNSFGRCCILGQVMTNLGQAARPTGGPRVKISRSKLATELVRAAEKEPDRMGARGSFVVFEDGKIDACILGQCYINCERPEVTAETHRKASSDASEWSGWFTSTVGMLGAPGAPFLGCLDLQQAAARLNDSGVTWGKIAKELNLVPGEDDGVAPLLAQEEVPLVEV